MPNYKKAGKAFNWHPIKFPLKEKLLQIDQRTYHGKECSSKPGRAHFAVRLRFIRLRGPSCHQNFQQPEDCNRRLIVLATSSSTLQNLPQTSYARAQLNLLLITAASTRGRASLAKQEFASSLTGNT